MEIWFLLLPLLGMPPFDLLLLLLIFVTIVVVMVVVGMFTRNKGIVLMICCICLLQWRTNSSIVKCSLRESILDATDDRPTCKLLA